MRRQLEIAPAGIPGEALLQQRLQPPAEVCADFGLSDTDYRDGLAVRARVSPTYRTLAPASATYAWSPGSSGADRLGTAPATAGDAQNFASSARSRTATCDSVSSPVRSTSPVTKTIRGPTTSSRR